MADCVGIDQASTASTNCLQVATQKLGQPPVFWGRYFKEPGNTSSIQYQVNLESRAGSGLAESMRGIPKGGDF